MTNNKTNHKTGIAQNPFNSFNGMIAETDVGERKPSNPLIMHFLTWTALTWSLYQLYIASPLVLVFTPWMNETVIKEFHLAFSIFLVFLSYPALKSSPHRRIPIQDWLMGAIAVAACLYLLVFKNALADRPGAPIPADVIISAIGVLLLLEATRRALGPPLMIVAVVFLTYTFLGAYAPDIIAHKGASLNKAASHYWLTTEGVFGVAIGVSATMVFLFVLFGALLEQAGAGNYFIRVAFALMGHFRGGPAKAAVVGSAMTGMISGSSIANVVTTGTFTIPLMKKVGFPAEKAGAIEVASSTNGQLTPPIMGAAAFLMIEYVGISYIEVIKHAFLPAIISYIALIYIVHLEALKANMQGLPRLHVMGIKAKLIGISSLLIILGILVYLLPPIITFIKGFAGSATFYIISIILFVAYLVLLRFAAAYPDLDTHHEIKEVPPIGPTVKVGLHFLLPVVVLIWLLTVERFSPGLSAFWATIFMVFIVLTQKPLLSLFRKHAEEEKANIRDGLIDLYNGLVNGARNMIGIGVATAAAGIVVGTVTLTGIGQVMIELVELMSGGNLFLVLIFTALISLILGMGLPTTANYIVVSSLMAPVIVMLGAKSGLVVPMVAVHMFVFYFGILADDTPPVGLAAFAAAAISRGDPIRTGLQGFMYDIRTAILPFLFIFNTELLMIGIKSFVHFIVVVFGAILAMISFASAIQRFFITKNRLYESLMMLLIAFTLFRPGFFMDKIYPPYERYDTDMLIEALGKMPAGTIVKLNILGQDANQKPLTRFLQVVIPENVPVDGVERMDALFGIQPDMFEGKMEILVNFSGLANERGIQNGWQIISMDSPLKTPPKQLMFVPAFSLWVLIYFMQRRRRRKTLSIMS